MKNELITAETKINLPSLPAEFSEDYLKAKFDKVEDEVKSEIADVDTEDGRKRIKDLAAKISKSNKVLGEPMRNHLRELKTLPKVLEKLARDSKDRFEKLRESVLEPLLSAQKYQDELLTWLNGIPMVCADPGITSEQMRGYLAEIENIDQSTIWPELAKKFKVAIEAATTSAEVTLERVTLQEAQAAELEVLRQQQAVAEQAEHDRKIAEAATAETQRRSDEKAASQRQDIERRAAESRNREEQAAQREAQAVRDAELAAKRLVEQEEQSKQRAAQAVIDAENAAIEREKQAEARERARIAEAEEEHKKLAAERAADKNLRIKVNRANLVVLVAAGFTEEQAKKFITMVAKKELPNILITY